MRLFGVLQQPSLGVTQLRGLYAALLAVAIGAVAAWRARWFGSWSAAWGPNVGVGAATIFVTVFFVNRILERRAKEQARDRVEQALRRLSGDFYTLALFLAWDYAAMHGESYERPPNALRGLLAHWKAGLETRDRRWPEDLHTFAGAKAIARDLEEQISRHERVLTHAFVAAGYRFIRNEPVGRNSYHYEAAVYDLDGWRRAALESLAEDLEQLLNVYEPYARQYLGADWALRLHDEAINSAELVSGHREAGRVPRA